MSITEPDLRSIVAAATPWLSAARWYSGASTPDTTLAFSHRLTETSQFLWLIVDGLNVPVIVTDEKVIDATEDPLGQITLYDLATGRVASAMEADPYRPACEVLSAEKIRSEQSNTSMIYTRADAAPVILKLFRVFAPGPNPDVDLPRVLETTGTVPSQYGTARVSVDGKRADVVVVQEFLEGAKDAWQVFRAYLEDGHGDPDEIAASIPALGAMTRRIHDELARALPVSECTAERKESLRESWNARARTAFATCPDLAGWEGAVDLIYSATDHVRWPSLQRIHGDLHLGQVLHVPGRGWCALDFEGEPLRPLAERASNDLALRDVAGMLRSFDYAAVAAEKAGGDSETLRAWAEFAQTEFMRGYGELSPEEGILLEALLLDKALYEVTYEYAQRPSWASIPLDGVLRIVTHEQFEN